MAVEATSIFRSKWTIHLCGDTYSCYLLSASKALQLAEPSVVEVWQKNTVVAKYCCCSILILSPDSLSTKHKWPLCLCLNISLAWCFKKVICRFFSNINEDVLNSSIKAHPIFYRTKNADHKFVPLQILQHDYNYTIDDNVMYWKTWWARA